MMTVKPRCSPCIPMLLGAPCRRELVKSMWNHLATLWSFCGSVRHEGMQAFSVEPVAALVSRLVKPDGGRLLLADPLERTRMHRRGDALLTRGSCTAGQPLYGMFYHTKPFWRPAMQPSLPLLRMHSSRSSAPCASLQTA